MFGRNAPFLAGIKYFGATYKNALIWAVSANYSLINFELMGVSEIITLLLLSYAVVKTECLLSRRKECYPDYYALKKLAPGDLEFLYLLPP